MTFKPTRRAVVAGIAGSAAMDLRAFAQNLQMPSSPVTLNFVDVAGNLALTQKAIESYRDKNPKLVQRCCRRRPRHHGPSLVIPTKSHEAKAMAIIDEVLRSGRRSSRYGDLACRR